MKATRMVKVNCIVSKRNLALLREMHAIYKTMLEYALDYALGDNISSFFKLKGKVYRELREKYPKLPSHFAYTVCQDASTRVKSFIKLKRKGKAKTKRPEVRKVSIWLDDHLWKLDGFTEVKIATHKGWVTLGIRPHKLFWKNIEARDHNIIVGRVIEAYAKLEFDIFNEEVFGKIPLHVGRNVYTYPISKKIMIGED